MALSERLAYILTLDSSQAVKGFQKVGDTADKELGKADQKLDKLGGNMVKFGAGAVAFAGIAGAGLLKLGGHASDLEESVNAVNVTFGDAADGILKLGEDAARAVGLSKTEFNGLSVQFSSFATTVAGKGGDVVATMDDLTTRAADFASVMNLDVAEAARVFQSGLAGETEPLKKFGIDLSAAAVESYALANGISEAGQKMSEAEKVQARYGLLMEQTAKTAGDFANTSDGAANQQRIFAAELANVKAEIGAGVLPMMTSLLQMATKVTGAFSNLSPETKGLIGKFAWFATVGIGLIGTLSFIGGQAIKLRTNFTTLGDDGTRSLNKTGKAAKGVGVALGVAAVAMAAYSAASYAAAESQRKFQENVAEVERAGDDAAIAFLEMELVMNRLEGTGAEEAFQNVAKESLGAAVKIRDAAASSEEYEARAAELGLTVDEMTAAIEAETAAQKEANRTQAEGTGLVDENTDAKEDNEDATEDLAVAVTDLDNKTRELTKAIEADIQASKDLRNERKRAADATLDAQDAEDDYFDALENMHTVNADVESSTRDRNRSTRDAIRATEDMIRKQLEAAGVVVDSERGERELTKAMTDQAIFLGGTYGNELLAHTLRIKGIPDEKITEIQALLDEGMVEEAKRKMDRELDKVEANPQVVPVGLEAARARIEAILGRRVNLSVNTYVPSTNFNSRSLTRETPGPDEAGLYAMQNTATAGLTRETAPTTNVYVTLHSLDIDEGGRRLTEILNQYARNGGARLIGPNP